MTDIQKQKRGKKLRRRHWKRLFRLGDVCRERYYTAFAWRTRKMPEQLPTQDELPDMPESIISPMLEAYRLTIAGEQIDA